MKIKKQLEIFGKLLAVGRIAVCAVVCPMLCISCETSSYFASVDTDSQGDTTTEAQIDSECRQVLTATFRDFTADHPDFEREVAGWGPARGLVKDTLSEDRKPIFNKIRGDCQLFEVGTCKPTEGWSGTPMWGIEVDGEWMAEETFFTWYHDNDEIDFSPDWYPTDEINRTIVQDIELTPNPAVANSYVFKSDHFFPLTIDEGFGESPVGSGKNFLFTTEIHTTFQYVPPQKFTFEGDDDLWVFVNDKLALDLGGEHVSFKGEIDFENVASELGIAPGGRYAMDIFHAERRTAESNFRIETNISCFIPVVVE